MKQVLIVRHAIAQEREAAAASGVPDAQRALTGKGRQRMRAAARGLALLVPELELIISSPLRRARQTAEILAENYGGLDVKESEALSPGAPAASLYRRLTGAPRRVALVGHEPDLGEWVSRALARGRSSFIHFKKGGACLLAFPAEPAAAQAELIWFCPPAVLRQLVGQG